MHYSLQICSWISVKAIANFILIASVPFKNRFAAEEEARKSVGDSALERRKMRFLLNTCSTISSLSILRRIERD